MDIILRGQKVVLSTDLAEHYRVGLRDILYAVRGHPERFTQERVFELTDEEYGEIKTRFLVLNGGGLRRVNPYAFTGEGVVELQRLLRGNV